MFVLIIKTDVGNELYAYGTGVVLTGSRYHTSV